MDQIFNFGVTATGIVTPNTPVRVGVMGDSYTATVVFDLSDVTIGEDDLIRADITDGMGGFYSSEHLTLDDGEVRFDIPIEVSGAGGIAQIHIVITDTETNTIKYSFPARLEFVSSNYGTGGYNQYRETLSGLAAEAKKSADNAEESATAAANSKTLAAQSAGEAQSAATGAGLSASSAGASASAALASATAAAGSATDAAASKAAAAISAGEADSAASGAANSASAASVSASNASTSATAAEASATSAAGSASSASTSASNAAASATTASASATSAESAKASAESSASSALSSATSANSAKTAAESSATAAASSASSAAASAAAAAASASTISNIIPAFTISSAVGVDNVLLGGVVSFTKNGQKGSVSFGSVHAMDYDGVYAICIKKDGSSISLISGTVGDEWITVGSVKDVDSLYWTELKLSSAILPIIPAPTSSDNGKFLRVADGAYALETVPNAEDNTF